MTTRALPTRCHGIMYGSFGMRAPLNRANTTMEIIKGSNRTPASSGPSPYDKHVVSEVVLFEGEGMQTRKNWKNNGT